MMLTTTCAFAVRRRCTTTACSRPGGELSQRSASRQLQTAFSLRRALGQGQAPDAAAAPIRSSGRTCHALAHSRRRTRLCSGRPRLQRSPGRLPGTHERLHVSECPIVLFQRVAEVCDGAALVRHTAATPYSLPYSCMAPYRCHALSRLPPGAIQPYNTIQHHTTLYEHTAIQHHTPYSPYSTPQRSHFMAEPPGLL